MSPRVGALASALVVLLLSSVVATSSLSAALEGVVNVNTATAEQLQMLPGVGEKRAEQIIEMRKQRGGFKSIDDLKEVKGIGDSMVDRLRDHVTLSGKTTATLE